MYAQVFFSFMVAAGGLFGRVAAGPIETGTDTVSACTHTSTFNNFGIAGGPVMTSTAYTATSTETFLIDCSGCQFASVTTVHRGGPGPVIISVVTVTAKTPLTTTTVACSPSTAIIH